MKLKFSILLILCFTTSLSLLAQPWLKELDNKSNPNFYDLQKAFNTYWGKKDKEENRWFKKLVRTFSKKKTENERPGYEQYKRWEWQMQSRVSETGEFPDPLLIWNENQKLKLQKRERSNAPTAAWTFMGPSVVPNGGGGAGRVNCVAFHPQNANTIWVGAPDGGVWKSVDGGATWTSNTDLLPNLGVSAIAVHPTNPDTIYIATGDAEASKANSLGVLQSVDGGLTWNTTGLIYQVNQSKSITRLLIHPTKPHIIYAATKSSLYKSENSGLTWSAKLSGNVGDLEFSVASPDTMYACTDADVFKSTDGGETWATMHSGINYSTIASLEMEVCPSNPNKLYLLSSNNTDNGFDAIYVSTDAGAHWVNKNISQNLLGWDSSGGDSGGQGWYTLSLAVSPTDENEVYVGGVNIWKSSDGGNSFSCNAHWYGDAGLPYVHADIHTLEFSPLSPTNLFTGCDGGVFQTNNHGSTWQDQSNSLGILQLYRISNSQTNSSKVTGGAQDNGTNMFDNNSWNYIAGGDGMETIIDYSDENTIYASYYYGSISRSNDGGQSFSDISPPTQGAWVTPYIQHPTDPATLFAGCDELYMSNDYGSSWNNISNGWPNGNTITALAVAPSDGNTIYASIYNKVFRTNDQGATWTQINSGIPLSSAISVTYIAVSYDDPTMVWLTCSGYGLGKKIYQSNNGGNSWTNISVGLPNVPTNCVAVQKGNNHAVYAGTDLGVFYKDDSLATWTSFNTSLPNVQIDELEIQFATNTLRAGTFGRGLWETPIPAPIYYTSVAKIDEEKIFKIYPTLNNGTFFIESMSARNKESAIEIYNEQGQLIFIKNILISSNNAECIDITSVSAGMYFVKVWNDKKLVTQKITVSK